MYIQFDISSIYHLIHILIYVYRDYTACHAIHLIHYDVVIFLLLFSYFLLFFPKMVQFFLRLVYFLQAKRMW